MRLNTVKKTGTLQLDSPPATGPLDLRDKHSLQAILCAMAEIDRIRALQKPSHKSHARAQLLQEMIVTALGVDSFAAAEQALASAQRKRVAASIKTLLERTAIREKRAAKQRVWEEVQEARRQARERKDDTRRKIIIGGTIIAAHRLSTVRDADLIVVMADGHAVEQGTHAELLAAKGAFARLVRAQALILD